MTWKKGEWILAVGGVWFLGGLVRLPVQSQTHAVSDICPREAYAGGAGFRLAVKGSGFRAGTPALNSVVEWIPLSSTVGTAPPPLERLDTSFVNGGELTATVPQRLITQQGQARVRVVTGDQASQPVPFRVLGRDGIVQLTICQLTPAATTVERPETEITVYGAGFLDAVISPAPSSQATVAQWVLGRNRVLLPTTYVSHAEVRVRAPSSVLANVGEASITMVCPARCNLLPSEPARFTVNPLPAIAVDPPMEPGVVQVPYTPRRLTVSGGTRPYGRWRTVGNLPPGLRLEPSSPTDAATATISGQPSMAGPYSFRVEVDDSAPAMAATAVRPEQVLVEAQPDLSYPGLPANGRVPADEQVLFRVASQRTSTLRMQGELVVTFEPEPTTNTGDGDEVGFLRGSTPVRSVAFTIESGCGQPCGSSEIRLRTGTVAGRITLKVNSMAMGRLQIPDSVRDRWTTPYDLVAEAPSISDVLVCKDSEESFTVTILGYSTTRDMQEALFELTPGSRGRLKTSSLSKAVAGEFRRWYDSLDSRRFGSSFAYVQGFRVLGPVSDISAISANIRNRINWGRFRPVDLERAPRCGVR